MTTLPAHVRFTRCRFASSMPGSMPAPVTYLTLSRPSCTPETFAAQARRTVWHHVACSGLAPPGWWARNAVPGEQSAEEWAAWGSGLNAGVAEAIAAARKREGGMQARPWLPQEFDVWFWSANAVHEPLLRADPFEPVLSHTCEMQSLRVQTWRKPREVVTAGLQSPAADLRLCLGSGQPRGFEYGEVTRRVVVFHGYQVGFVLMRLTVSRLLILVPCHALAKLETLKSACVKSLCCAACKAFTEARQPSVMCQDTLVPPTAAQWLSETLSDCKLIMCAGATHQMYIMTELLACVCQELAAAAG